MDNQSVQVVEPRWFTHRMMESIEEMLLLTTEDGRILSTVDAFRWKCSWSLSHFRNNNLLRNVMSGRSESDWWIRIRFGHLSVLPHYLQPWLVGCRIRLNVILTHLEGYYHLLLGISWFQSLNLITSAIPNVDPRIIRDEHDVRCLSLGNGLDPMDVIEEIRWCLMVPFEHAPDWCPLLTRRWRLELINDLKHLHHE